MSVNRMSRVNELLRREISESLYPILAGEDVDLATVTVTEVDAAPNLRNARVRVSINLEDNREQQTMFNVIRRHRVDIQSAINRDMALKFTPKLRFVLDGSIAMGSHILDVIEKLDIPATTADETADDATTEEQG